MGNLLEANGIPVERKHGCSVVEMFDALNSGEKVIVGLDANEIWEPQVDEFGNPVEQPDQGHAVWVTGIQMDDNGQLDVVLNDSGVSDGAGKTVPMKHFLNAWDDYGNFATITNLKTETAIA